MYSDDPEYRTDIEADGRSISVFMSLGVDIDNTASDDISSVSVEALPLSNAELLTDANYELTRELATFEGYGIPTAPSASMIAPPLQAQDYPPETGVWSADISDGAGNIEFEMTISLSHAHTSALTIYTEGPDILAGTVTFRNGNDEDTVELTTRTGSAVASGAHTYDSVTIHVTKITETYRHLRVVEVEFGDSITLATNKLGGEVVYIDEIDTLQVGMPLSELDLELINVLGDYDVDKPDTLYAQLAIGNPINLSFTVNGSTRRTVPVAHLFIGQKNSNGDRLMVTAYDVRWNLGRSYKVWSINPSKDLGSTLAELFVAHGLGYVIDPAVNEMYPEGAHTFSDESTVLDDLQKLAQAYGLVIRPSRMGNIVVSTAWDSDSYGTIPVRNMYSWPSSNQYNRYNVIDIRYGSDGNYGRYVQDFSEVGTVKNILAINSDLILTEQMAIDVYTRIRAQIYGSASDVEWRGDPAMDLTDMVGVHSRWTQEGTAQTFRATKREIRYDGAYREITTFIR